MNAPKTGSVPTFNFDNTFAKQMDGFFVPWKGEEAPAPEILVWNEALANELELNAGLSDCIEVYAGSTAPQGAVPLAQAYAGHQFGGFSQQLGDGRALLLGEIVDANGARHDIQLKGSGRTPFSRGGDGKAVIGPVLREYLMGEAMHALGIPTTRALAAVATGEDVMREGPQPGAVLTRVAASHLRVGTFQFFAARGEHDKVRQLADYAIARHYPHLVDAQDKYLAFLRAVIDAQIALVVKWVQVGFVHGVMNTDNVTISGETIDYGPCAFIDIYDPKAVFSSIDEQGRYAYGNQPVIAQWNLARFAETLLPLINADDNEDAIRQATNEINGIGERYLAVWLKGMRQKVGLNSAEDADVDLINNMFKAMEGQSVDYTQFFRLLGDAADGRVDGLVALFADAGPIKHWFQHWQDRCLRDPQSPAERRTAMDEVNPIYIPRNHLVEAALVSAAAGDLAPFHKLLGVLAKPFEKRDNLGEYEQSAAKGSAPYKTFCGT